MALDSLFSSPQTPQMPQVPDRNDPSVIAARRRARQKAGSIRRKTVLGGKSGGAETVARKTLLGE